MKLYKGPYRGFGRRRRSNSGAVWAFLFVVAALVAGGYLLVQTRLGNGIQIGRNVRTPTPLPVATATRSVEDFIRLVNEATARGDYRGAIDNLDKASRRRPNDPDLHRQAARLLVFLGQPAKAEQRARKALEIDPNHVPSRAALCMALEWQKRIPEAITECQAALAADPNYATAHAYLAEAQADSGDFNLARATAQQAVDLEPQNVDALRNLGYAYDMFGQHDTALYHYRRALEISPNMPHVLNAVGRIYYILGQSSNAVKSFKRVIEMDPDNSEAYWRLGTVYQVVLGDFPSARIALDQSIELDPLNVKALTQRGSLNFQVKNFFGAVDDFTRALTTSQQISETLTPVDYLNFGFALQWTQQCDKAIPMFDKVLELAPTDETLAENVEVGYRRCGK